MINTILDACRYVLEDQGEAQSSYWLSSLMMEMKLWRASESQVRRALDKDIQKYGESSPFVKVGEDLYAVRPWKGRYRRSEKLRCPTRFPAELQWSDEIKLAIDDAREAARHDPDRLQPLPLREPRQVFRGRGVGDRFASPRVHAPSQSSHAHERSPGLRRAVPRCDR